MATPSAGSFCRMLSTPNRRGWIWTWDDFSNRRQLQQTLTPSPCRLGLFNSEFQDVATARRGAPSARAEIAYRRPFSSLHRVRTSEASSSFHRSWPICNELDATARIPSVACVAEAARGHGGAAALLSHAGSSSSCFVLDAARGVAIASSSDGCSNG